MTPSKERTLMKTIKGMINAIATTQDKVDNQQDREIAKLRKEMKKANAKIDALSRKAWPTAKKGGK